jgi:cytochrome P450
MAQQEATRSSDILKRKDLFTRFLLLNEEGTETYTDKNLRDTMLNFVIAGRDTTAVTLSWFVYMICSHPDVADKIHEELCAFEKEREKEEQANFNHSVGISFPEDTLSNFSHRVAKFSQHLIYESLLKLQYLHAAILETLRLYPAVPLVRFVLRPPATPKFLQHRSDRLYSNMHNHGLLHCSCEPGLVCYVCCNDVSHGL